MYNYDKYDNYTVSSRHFKYDHEPVVNNTIFGILLPSQCKNYIPPSMVVCD